MVYKENDMELNIDLMLEKQEKLNAKIANTEPIKEDEDTVILVDCYKETVSVTNFIPYEDRVVLTRYIGMKVRKVTFGAKVLLTEVIPYIELNDSMFLKVCDKSFNYVE